MDKEAIEKLEKLDKRLKLRRAATVTFFGLLSLVLVLYVVRIERKLYELSQSPAVVIYKNATEVSATEDVSDGSVPSEDGYSDEVDSDTPSDVTVTDDAPQNVSAPTTEAKQNNNHYNNSADEIYYVTASGKKYHRAGCRYLTGSEREISLSEIRESNYTPCSVCMKE